MTREEIIEHMKVMGQNAARMDEVMMYVMTRKDCEVVMAAAELLEALPPTHIHEEYPEHDWYRNEDGTINGSAMDCDTHSGPMCKRCGDSFCVFCEPDGFGPGVMAFHSLDLADWCDHLKFQTAFSYRPLFFQ